MGNRLSNVKCLKILVRLAWGIFRLNATNANSLLFDIIAINQLDVRPQLKKCPICAGGIL